MTEAEHNVLLGFAGGAKKALVAAVWVALSGAGCDSALYGEGDIYLWNGTEDKVEFIVQGRTPAEASLKFEQGQLLENVVAGEYVVTPTKKGVPQPPIPIVVTKDRMTVVNLDGRGCFARTDVSGMYTRGKDPVRVLALYEGEQVLPLQNEIAVKPGKRLPTEAPRITRETVFQRLVVVPCNLLEDDDADEKVAEFVRRLR